MATDAFPAMFLTPQWLVFIAICFAIAACCWMVVLGPRFREVGFAPLAIGMVFFIIGCVVLCFYGAWETFAGRAEGGTVAGLTFWQIAPGWTIYTFAIFMTLGPPFLAITLVPLAAILIRRRILDIVSVLVALVAIWLIVAFLDWAQPMNIWEESHRLEALLRTLIGSASTILGLGGVFFLGVGLMLGRRNDRRSLQQSNRPIDEA